MDRCGTPQDGRPGFALTIHADHEVDGIEPMTVVGVLHLPDVEAACALEERLAALAAKDPLLPTLSWDRIGHGKMDHIRPLMDVFEESDAIVSTAFLFAEQMPLIGRCAVLYRLYRTALDPWLVDGADTHVLVESGFDELPCGGEGCRFVQIGGSRCEARWGHPMERFKGHLLSDDLETVLERMLSPMCSVEVSVQGEGEMVHLFHLAAVLLEVSTYIWSGRSGSVAKGEICERLLGLGSKRLRLVDGRQRTKAFMRTDCGRGSDVRPINPEGLPAGQRI